MLRYLADENFVWAIVNGLRQRNPKLDVALAEDLGLLGADDPTILARAAAESRIVLTHDVRTMKDFAYVRVRQGLPMAGVFEVSGRQSRYAMIEELQIIAECSEPAEWENRVVFLPL